MTGRYAPKATSASAHWWTQGTLAAVPAVLLGASAVLLARANGGADRPFASGDLGSLVGLIGIAAFVVALVVSMVLASRQPRGVRAARVATALLVIVATTTVVYLGMTAGVAAFDAALLAP